METVFTISAILVVAYGLYKMLFKEKKFKNIVYKQTIIQYMKNSNEEFIFNKLNEIRSRNNLNPLFADGKTTILAHRRNKEMIASGILSHKLSADEFGELLNLGADSVGEIIGRKYREPESVVKAWVKSADHYNQIINKKYDWCGVDVEVDNDGIKWYCVIFGNDDKTN
jgi:uncharacterized protein YkwD